MLLHRRLSTDRLPILGRLLEVAQKPMLDMLDVGGDPTLSLGQKLSLDSEALSLLHVSNSFPS